MDTSSFPIVDLAIIFIVFVSFVVGFVRGVTKEILSILSWVGGIFLTISIFPHVKSFTRDYISHKLIADFVTICVLFVLFLTILSSINYFCSKIVKKSIFNNADRFLGGILGIIRGIIIVAAINIGISNFLIKDDDHIPEYLADSKIRPYIINISNSIIIVLPDNLQDTVMNYMNKMSKDSIIEFVGENNKSQDRISISSQNNNNTNSVIEDEQFIIPDKKIESQENAKDLATLKPKISEDKDNNPNTKKTEDTKKDNTKKQKSTKEKLDMDRFLDDV